MIEPLSKGGGKSFLGVTRFPSGSPNNGGKRLRSLLVPMGKALGSGLLTKPGMNGIASVPGVRRTNVIQES